MTDETVNINEIVEKLVSKGEHKVSENKQKFAMLTAINPNLSNTDAIKAISDTNAPTTMGYKYSKDPVVAELQEKIREKIAGIELYSNIQISPKLIKSGLLKEAVNAGESRDRKNAWDSLAKAEGLFKDIVEHHDYQADQDFLAELEKQLGKQAAITAAEELGLDYE